KTKKLTLEYESIYFECAVQALNTILEQWQTPANTDQWNTTGDPCSGAALDGSITIDDTNYNPFIKCDCTYNRNTTCHITAFKVYAQDAKGVLPDELWNLVYLTNLRLGLNYLTGPISSGIGNLTRMQWLDFGTNAFSGPIPKELGKLTDLRSLGIGANNFSGSLPSEIGNLKKLQQLYIDSSGATGVIPSTFANLVDLQTVWASDMELTGPIPDFIGNWSQLTELRLEGNSFRGPIPSSFSKLTSLQQLRISGLLNGSSSLDFVTSLTSLNILVLKNNNITGPIPRGIGALESLTQLDLSFNSLTGQIPDSVFSLSTLAYLFLGNNRLTGAIPSQKSSSLTTISLPSGLNCLQNGFPCNAGAGRFSDFAVNCGGPQIRASNQVVYESGLQTLGPATYFVPSSDKWAVSNVGLPASNNNVTYTFDSPRQFISQDSELFQTAKLSAGSLRYYRLGLQNGNYSVLLQFAENQIEDSGTWKSLGRRVFDILIQGNRVERDFDIRKAAGGRSYRPVQKNYTARVTANFLEIHLFWAGKGTCCIPVQGAYGPMISAVSVTPLFQPRPISSSTSHTAAIIVGIVVPVILLALLSLGACWFFKRRKRLRAAQDELAGIDAKAYSYAELKSATGDFDPSNKLGEGGFGSVYKGVLNGNVVAVKQLAVTSHQGKDQFITEIATISAVQHRNLVKLNGCCIDGQKRLLVYEYLENKSLDKVLFGENKLELNWAKRFEPNFNEKKTHMSTGVAGTVGYLAPEYAMRGHLTEKVDVFAFGVVALEIVSGRSNHVPTLPKEEMYLLDWAWHLYESGLDIELVDKRLKVYNKDEVKRVIEIAFLCTQTSPGQRPTMARVLAMLSGDVEVGTIPSKPTYLTDWAFDDDSSYVTSEASEYSRPAYSSTTTSNYTTSRGLNSPADNVSLVLS
uniref:non-specific serine/threonine protein kinase n=1 Tax=Chenopodium quinoa TaxID=63459 RepID=A0A803LHQ1_CHEQI